MEILLTENLIINTEISGLGYRFHAIDPATKAECFSEWFLRYEIFLYEQNIFILSAKMSGLKNPGWLIEFETDRILNCNYKARKKFKIPRLPNLIVSRFWRDRQSYCDHKKKLDGQQKIKERTTLKTFEGETLEAITQSELYLIKPLNKIIVATNSTII